MKAVDMGRVNRHARGDQRLYKVDPPIKGWGSDGGTLYEYVVASAADVFGEPETYLFPADAKGNIVDWCELDGSQKGTLSQSDVIEDMGYEIVTEGERDA